MRNSKNVLVVGGAGFIGSHTVLALLESGYNPIIFDNLSSGHSDSIFGETFIEGELDNKNLLTEVFKAYNIDCVIHFAALIEAGQSVITPLPFYINNVGATLILLDVMRAHNVKRIVFSSTAAVYGNQHTSALLHEGLPKKPINPYGISKMMIEDILKSLSTANDFQVNVLRYFNACGADPRGRAGERHNPETHLIPLIIEAAMGVKQQINIYGTDYATRDGTCIRDYVHVSDLAQAHVAALQNLIELDKPIFEVFNAGSGKGYSVKEIIDAVRAVTNNDFKVIESERRPGDPASLIADTTLINSKLGWTAERSEIHKIVLDTWNYANRA